MLNRYKTLAHAIQTGVLQKMGLDGDPGQNEKGSTSPKHLRTGLDCRASDHSALAGLLIQKGLISVEEYEEALIAALTQEKERYERELSERIGAKITLG